MNRDVIDAWLERGILALVLGILVFGPLATGAVRSSDFLIIQGATGVLLLMWAGRLAAARRLRLFWPPVCWAVLAFVVYAIVRYVQADIEYVARKELIRVLVYAAVFVVIINNVLRKESVMLVAVTLVFVAMGISLYAIYQWGANSNMVWNFVRPEGYGRRGSGTYICPNHLAGFLEMVLPLGVAYTLTGRQSQMMKIALGYATVVILAGIGVSLSRAGWVAAAFGLMLFFIIKMANRHYRLPAAVLLAGFLAAGLIFIQKSYVAQQRLSQTLEMKKESSATVRYLIWSGAFDMWRRHPWLGVGPGHFDYRFREFRPPTIQLRPEYVHNDYLNTLADWGVVGLGLIVGTLGALVWGVVRCWKYVQRSTADIATGSGGRGAPQSNRSAFMLGGCAGLFALLVHSAFDFNMQIPANAILAVALMALLGGHLRFATDRYWYSLRAPLRTVAIAACVALVGYFAAHGYRRGVEERRLSQAARAEQKGDPERLGLLLAAFEVEARNFATAYEIGEIFRLRSWQGDDDYRELAETAKAWFEKAAKLNPHDPYNPMRIGMCLDWLRRHDEAAEFFARAGRLDPNGYFVLAHLGWHQFQIEDYAAAQKLFERSIELTPYPYPNPIARSYLDIIERRRKDVPSPLPSPVGVQK